MHRLSITAASKPKKAFQHHAQAETATDLYSIITVSLPAIRVVKHLLKKKKTSV